MRIPLFCGWVRYALVALAAFVFASSAHAEKGKLQERLTPQVLASVYPAGAERLGPEEGSPPAIAVYKNGKIAAYIFSTLDVVAAPGYASTPFDIIGGIDVSGRLTGAKVIFHAEPHILHDPDREQELNTFLGRQAGRPLRGGSDPLPPDYVADSTVSARAMRTALLVSASLVLRPRISRAASNASAESSTLPPPGAGAFRAKSVAELLADGSLVKRRITSGDVASALRESGRSNAKLDWPLGKDDDLYIEFTTGLATPAEIGAHLLGLVTLEDDKSRLPPGTELIYVAANGPYNFFGTKYVQAAEGNRFDRLRIVQGGNTFTFRQDDYIYAVPVAGQELAGLFALRPNSGFDPAKPWRVEILVNGPGTPPVSIPFGVDYKVPDLRKIAATPAPPAATTTTEPLPGVTISEEDINLELPQPPPAWVEAWSASRANVALLVVLLSALTLIFAFQSRLARFRTAHRVVRNGFLAIVLVWLGWIAGAQLSIVHIITYLRAPFQHFDIGFYLAEPLIVILAAYAFVSVLLIGRGVFCGWLCPFGALQELLARASHALRIPQWNPRPALEQRLWMGKYIAAAVLLMLVLTGADPSGATLEIEPFKTAITAKFTRAWPYALYAGALLSIGLFSERAYCRFLCPLGGVLATLDRLHILNLLKRRPECGSPCRLCERACPVRAILPTGKIVTSECFQCLDCQVEYYDDKRCPPLARAAKLRTDVKPAVRNV